MNSVEPNDAVWLWALSGCLSIVVGVLSITFWRLWGTLATKVELLATKTELVDSLRDLRDEIVNSDYEHDNHMERRIRDEIAQARDQQTALHQENAKMFSEIRADIKNLLGKRP